MYVGRELYAEITDRAAAREIFAKSVSRVEIETHSYCNRRCSYCPNVVGDRLGANLRMPQEMWTGILRDLAEIDYSSNLVLNYYNEPLADRAILDRIREARALLPRARIMIYSNGDYLEPGFIDELSDAGLNYLHISIHLKREDRYTDLYVVNRITEISVRMGIAAKLTTIRSGEMAIARAPHRAMEIEIRGINFYKHGTDRGGLIEDIDTASNRTAACYFPYSHFVVSYEGLIVPCCHIRADRSEHAQYVYGNLANYGSIYQAFTSAPAAAWRLEVGGAQAKRSPCDTCSAGTLSPGTNQQQFDAAYVRNAPQVQSA